MERTKAEIVAAELRAGTLAIEAVVDYPGSTGVEREALEDVERAIRRAYAITGKQADLQVIIMRQRPSREALEAIVHKLRDALDQCADETEGWPAIGIADVYEESRGLVPDAPEA